MSTPATRAEWQRWLFPQGIPRLWCPPITHVSAARTPDLHRIRQHLQALAPHVGGLLVPGSTGEGWVMSDAEVLAVLAATLDALPNRDGPVDNPEDVNHPKENHPKSDVTQSNPRELNHPTSAPCLLVGILKTTRAEMLASLDTVMQYLHDRTGQADPLEAMRAANVVGFTICPPAGADRDQDSIQADVSAVLDRGWPIALYQLPQVTHNEIAPATVARLAATYPHFIMFKDTSGHDRVANAGLDLGGVFLVRGAEGGYLAHSRGGGGRYDGLLLSSANGLAAHLARILRLAEQGQQHEAAEVSRRVEQVIRRTFARVAGFPVGNVFANANKIIDHIMAYGPAALQVPPPLTFDGTALPVDAICDVMDYLNDDGLLPYMGYLKGGLSEGRLSEELSTSR